MKRIFWRLRWLVIVVVVLVVAGGLQLFAYIVRDRNQRSIPSVPPPLEIGDLLGHAVRVDRERGEIVGDFGRAKGVEPGMKVRVHSPPGPKPTEGDVYRGEFEITAVGDKETTARRIGGPVGLEPGDNRACRAGEEVFNASDPEARRLRSLATGDEPNAIRELTQTRLNAARKWLEIAEPFTENGVMNQDRLIQASRGVMEAERDAAKTHDEEIAAIEGHMNRMTTIVERISNNNVVDGETINGPNGRDARAEQAATALMLAKARRGKLPSR